jgi:hypothetical protein
VCPVAVHTPHFDEMSESRPTKRPKHENDAHSEVVEEPEKPYDAVPREPRAVRAVFFQDIDVGIECHLHPETPGFRGDFKQRYSDFLVNELDASGNVVHLTDTRSIEGNVRDNGEQHLDKQQVDKRQIDRYREEKQQHEHSDDSQQVDRHQDDAPQEDEQKDDTRQEDKQKVEMRHDVDRQLYEKSSCLSKRVENASQKVDSSDKKPGSRDELERLFDRPEDYLRVLAFYMQPKSERPEELLMEVGSDYVFSSVLDASQ